MARRWPNKLKNKARLLRRKGYSYGQLTNKIGVPKSTLHLWIRGIKKPARFTKQDRIRWIKEIQPLGALANKRKREEKLAQIRKSVQEEVLQLPCDKHVQKALAAMLYWAEGAKGRRDIVVFANTDPRLVLLFITLLRKCYDLDESKFRVKLYTHSYHGEAKLKEYWSQLLDIPKSQFNKSYLKMRSPTRRFRRNLAGICFLKYNSIYLKEELILHALSIAEKIAGRVDVPVVQRIE